LEYILSDVGEAAGVPAKNLVECCAGRALCVICAKGQQEEFVREKLGLSPISWQETRSKIKRLIELQTKPEPR